MKFKTKPGVYKVIYVGKEDWPKGPYEAFDQGLSEILVIQCNSFNEKYVQRAYFELNFKRIEGDEKKETNKGPEGSD